MARLATDRYFTREVRNVVASSPAWDLACPGTRSLRGLSPGQKAGLRYESRALEYLYRFDLFLDHLPFNFFADGTGGRAIPDGVLLVPSTKELVVVEVKLRHTTEAWFQLNRFYVPIVQKAFPTLKVVPLELVKSYDPGVMLPGRSSVVEHLDRWLAAPKLRGEHYIGIYSGRF